MFALWYERYCADCQVKDCARCAVRCEGCRLAGSDACSGCQTKAMGPT